MNLTDEQRDAIGTRGRVIVSASAGSGKTFVMINRLVDLVLNGADVQNVLALTFTNKAAAQMRDRLRAALIKRIPEADEGARYRIKAQLKALPLAEIGTIHAFCGRLARSYFYLAETDPAFRIVSPDDAEGNALSAKAADEVFEEAYESGGEEFADLLAVYFRKKKDVRLRRLVLSLYRAVRGTEDPAALLGRVGKEDLFSKACGILFGRYREDAAFLRERAEAHAAYFEGKNAKAATVCRDVAARCAALLAADELFGMAAAAQAPLEVAVMPRTTKAEGEERIRLKDLSACSKAIKELNAELREYGAREEEYARHKNANRRAAALASLALRYGDAYAALKREANVLDYDDLEQCALRILRNDAVQKELREKYRYVFVDEYQDVNPVQEKIISLVSGEEVFLVGDPKQAIYGFRGSRSQYFIDKTKSLEHPLSLTSNFRSAAEVLDAVNRVFAPLSPDYPPMNGGLRYGSYRGGVFFHTVREAEKERRERGIYSVLESAGRAEPDALAEQAARLAEEELGKSWYDVDEEDEAKRFKTVTYGDIAVLTRKNTGDAERIVRALAARGIPVTSSSKINVCDCFEARLLIDWLSWLDNAEQDIPLATAMLSAIGGFTDGELVRIRARFPSPFTFREACAEYRAKMADGMAKKLNAFWDTAATLRKQSRIRTAAELMNMLLAMGLEAQIAAKPAGRDRLARVRRLIAEAERCGGIHEFLARLKASGDRVEYAESGGEGAVKVLTMHASKGLEYPVVILASLDGNFHGAEKDELMWTEELLAVPRCYDTEKKLVSETLMRRAAAVLQRREELLQERNLLYVAMTRARCRLHMLFEERDHALSPRYAKRFSDMIDFVSCADYFVPDGEAELPPAPERHAYASENRGAEELAALVSVYAKPYAHASGVPLPVKDSASGLIRAQETPASADFDDWEGGHTSEEGLAYHAFLEHVEFGKDAEEELARMREQGVLSEERLSLLDAGKLRKILAMPCFAALAGKRVLREQTFLARIPAREIYDTDAEDEVVFQGAIDLLCETPQGYLIIDYKYSGRGDDGLRERYGKQILLYKKAAARALRVDENTISARIVNVARLREIEL